MEKIVLIDGNNLLFRSYYATAYTGNIMRNSKGFPTNGLYGFINMLNKIVNEEKPNYVMVAFDKGKTFRHDEYTEYKGGRNATPDDLKLQFPVAKEIVEALGMTYYEIDNYEADDIIGTFVKAAEEDIFFYSTIVSSDKDLLQLISDDCEMKLLKQVGNIRMTKTEFINTYGIEPIRMIDLKALMGDPSDNIPGVKGIGEKTALTLLKEYGTLDGIYKNIDNIKGKLKEKLELGKEDAYKSYHLVTIVKNVPIDTSFEKIKYRGIDALKYISILEEMEFYSLLKKIDIKKEDIRKNMSEEISYKIITSSNLNDFVIDSDYSMYLEILGYNYHKAKPIGVGICSDKNNYYIPYEVLEKNKELLNLDYKIYTYDIKKVLVSFSHDNIKLSKCNYDLMIAGYLLNINVKDDIAYLMNSDGTDVEFYENIFGNEKKLSLPEEDKIIKNIMKKAKYIYDTREEYLNKLNSEEELRLFNEIEMPLSYVLADMEITGVSVDRKYLEDMSIELKNRMDILEKEIYELAGEQFNISSPKQLGEILFVHMGIPYPKKVKDCNFSTGKDILDKIESYSPIVSKIKEYRLCFKLYKNYTIGLMNEILEDGRIHTIFNQTLTRTGRLSSSNPNLQNIPIRIEEGRQIRKAFIADDNSIILSSDYSQIELRIFAHLSKANNLISAFTSGQDIHKKTASDIFKVDISEVTKEMRYQAKAVNFGILYGISSFGLSEDLNIDISEAKKFIDDYLKTFPGIKEYTEGVIRDAYENGYVTTIMNRKRVIEELKSNKYMIKQAGERIALNTPVQGSSADILKKAMIEIYEEFNKNNLKSKMLVQVHDELLFNVVKEEEKKVTEIVTNIMENTYKLSVPLKVEINTGIDWYEAK
ncbi:MAG: DNA polymerase I [bacterium]|nr:DNA polymerase I [bacterium]